MFFNFIVDMSLCVNEERIAKWCHNDLGKCVAMETKGVVVEVRDLFVSHWTLDHFQQKVLVSYIKEHLAYKLWNHF